MPKHEKSQHQKIGDKKRGGKITKNKLYLEQIWMLAENRMYLKLKVPSHKEISSLLCLSFINRLFFVILCS